MPACPIRRVPRHRGNVTSQAVRPWLSSHRICHQLRSFGSLQRGTAARACRCSDVVGGSCVWACPCRTATHVKSVSDVYADEQTATRYTHTLCASLVTVMASVCSRCETRWPETQERVLRCQMASPVAQAVASEPKEARWPLLRLEGRKVSSLLNCKETQEDAMKAVVYDGPRNVSVKDVPDARIERPTDVLVKITSTNICGSDLHMYEGRTDMEPGRVLGHENLGQVTEVGNGVVRIKVGDWVCLPFNIGCGFCRNCEHGLTAFCLTTNPDPNMAGAAYGFAALGPYNGGRARDWRVAFGDLHCLGPPTDVQEEQPDLRN